MAEVEGGHWVDIVVVLGRQGWRERPGRDRFGKCCKVVSVPEEGLWGKVVVGYQCWGVLHPFAPVFGSWVAWGLG